MIKKKSVKKGAKNANTEGLIVRCSLCNRKILKTREEYKIVIVMNGKNLVSKDYFCTDQEKELLREGGKNDTTDFVLEPVNI
jgi:hypothetical protein